MAAVKNQLHRQVVKKTDKTQTYNTEELENLNIYLDEMYEQTGNVACIAVKMNFFMGLRVGEQVALKWEDICEGNQIHIVREEVRDQVANEVTVADHTNTHTDRFVYLIPDALEILEKLPRAGEYILMRDGKRLTSRQINYVLEKYAERFDLQVKSSHKLRKTYASMCNANGVPIDFIREQLGHASLSTTYGYIYNPLTEALSRKKDTTSEQKIDSILSARKPDNEVPMTENITDNVVSLEAFQSRKLTVPTFSDV